MGSRMPFGHEKLDVYRFSINYGGWENSPEYQANDPDCDSDPDRHLTSP